jgi:hypothetical protein
MNQKPRSNSFENMAAIVSTGNKDRTAIPIMDKFTTQPGTMMVGRLSSGIKVNS